MRYERHLFICTHKRPDGQPSCGGQGSQALLEAAKEAARGAKGVRVNASGCLGACVEGPAAVLYPDGTWFTLTTSEEVVSLVKRQLVAP